MHELPARKTIKRLGGFHQVADGLDLSPGTVHAWTETKKNKSDAIPRWWYGALKALADSKGVELPKPLPKRKAKKAA